MRSKSKFSFIAKPLRDFQTSSTKPVKKNKRPSWIGPELWETLLALFDNSEEKNKREKAKENRASTKGGSMYTGGSINQIQHAQDMSKKIRRIVDVGELFKRTHTRKDTGEFVEERAKQTYEDYMMRLEQAISSQSPESSASNNLDELKARCWLEAAGGKKKGKVYGTGSAVSYVVRGQKPLTQPSGSTTTQKHLEDRVDTLTLENQTLKERLASLEQIVMQNILPRSPPPSPHDHDQNLGSDDDDGYDSYND
ncbi:hypothetical protein RIF29_41598 [Crotalaria pallida]|uniref:Transposase n=1 Tax=Crotalaria pallida TaxID=3830 RepID=A0AAN9E8C6_CROPI